MPSMASENGKLAAFASGRPAFQQHAKHAEGSDTTPCLACSESTAHRVKKQQHHQLQQILIPDADAPASFLGNKLVKWKALLSFGAIPFPDFGTGKRLACTKWLWIWGRTASTLPGVMSASGTKTFLPQAVRALRAGRIHLILW